MLVHSGSPNGRHKSQASQFPGQQKRKHKPCALHIANFQPLAIDQAQSRDVRVNSTRAKNSIAARDTRTHSALQYECDEHRREMFSQARCPRPAKASRADVRPLTTALKREEQRRDEHVRAANAARGTFPSELQPLCTLYIVVYYEHDVVQSRLSRVRCRCHAMYFSLAARCHVVIQFS